MNSKVSHHLEFGVQLGLALLLLVMLLLLELIESLLFELLLLLLPPLVLAFLLLQLALVLVFFVVSSWSWSCCRCIDNFAETSINYFRNRDFNCRVYCCI